jgi:hypothetical protein
MQEGSWEVPDDCRLADVSRKVPSTFKGKDREGTSYSVPAGTFQY